MPKLSELVNYHYAEWFVLRDPGFMGTVEAAMRYVAVEIYLESPETPGHRRRASVALNIATSDTDGDSEAARFRNVFATIVLRNPALRSQFFDTSSPTDATIPMEQRIKPWLMDEEALRNVIRGAWDAAADVTVSDTESSSVTMDLAPDPPTPDPIG